MAQRKAGPRIERRRSARADANLSMRVEGRPGDGELTQIVTESKNISASGVYCASPHYLAPLSKVALTIVLPNRRSRAGEAGPQRLLKCDGIVVRCLPVDDGPRRHTYELACSFIALDPRHRELIEEFVTWRGLEALSSDLVARDRAPAPRTTRALPASARGSRSARAPAQRATRRAPAARARRSGGR